VRNDFAREQINSFQRYVQGAVPFVFAEFDNIFADGDAGAVAEDVDLSFPGNDRLDGGAAIGGGNADD